MIAIEAGSTIGRRSRDRPLNPDRPPSLSLALLRAARPSGTSTRMTVAELIGNLGERSFGWCLLVFALFNLTPMPIGSNLVTALPLVVLSWQMVWGWHHVHVPRFLGERDFEALTLRRAIARATPVMRRLERLLRPRRRVVFAPRYYRPISLLVFAVSVALFLPIPFSGLVSAAALAVFAAGLIAEDGAVALAGLCLGVLALSVTVAIGTGLLLGIHLLF